MPIDRLACQTITDLIKSSLIRLLPQKSAPTHSGPSGSQQSAPQQKKKESIVDLTKYMQQNIRVKFQGGREVTGILKGFDKLLNLVLDETVEYIRGKFRSVAISDCNSSMKLTLASSFQTNRRS